VLHRELAPFGLPSAAEVVLITLASVAVGALLYRGVERPFLRLRDRHVPATAPAAPARLSVPA
ncbi:MAG: acyltransferase, partial [Ideonella sp.]|nr:acyltransferase [Ideonella sp.]